MTGSGDHPEIDEVVEHGFEDAGAFGAADVHADLRILTLELGEHLGKDVQAGGFVGADDDLAARRALEFGDLFDDALALAEGGFRIAEEDLARLRQRDLAAGAVEELRSDLVFERPDLRGDGRLGAEAALRRTRKIRVPGDLDKGGELVEIHGKSILAERAPSRREREPQAVDSRPQACYKKSITGSSEHQVPQ